MLCEVSSLRCVDIAPRPRLDSGRTTLEVGACGQILPIAIGAKCSCLGGGRSVAEKVSPFICPSRTLPLKPGRLLDASKSRSIGLCDGRCRWKSGQRTRLLYKGSLGL